MRWHSSHFCLYLPFLSYFLLELLPGGEFFNFLQSAGKLSEEKCRFYSAAVVLALGELHRNKIAYRDLKPENMVSFLRIRNVLYFRECAGCR